MGKIIAEWKETKKKNQAVLNKKAIQYEQSAKKVKKAKLQKQRQELEQKRKLVREWREQKDQEESEQQRLKEEAELREKMRQMAINKQRRSEQKALLLEQAER